MCRHTAVTGVNTNWIADIVNAALAIQNVRRRLAVHNYSNDYSIIVRYVY